MPKHKGSDMATVVEKDLPDDATHEQITEFVDHLIGGEDKPAEKADETKPTDETPGGAEAAEGKPEGEDLTEKVDDRAWLDDDLKAEVAAMGIGEEQLADFSSREELDKALKFLDFAAMSAGKKAGEEGGDAKQAERAKFVKKEEKPEGETSADYAAELDPEAYDEGVIQEFNKMRDYFNGRIKALEDDRDARLAAETESRFDTIVESLGHVDLFGKTGEESKSQLANRHKLYDAQVVYMAGLSALGREGRLDRSLVERVLRMEFADHLSKQERKALTQKITRQSAQRMGGGTTKPTEAQESIMDEMKRLYQELEGD